MDKDRMDDRSVLALLERLAAFQRAIRLGPADPRAEAGLTFFRAYYQRLPASVARRLMEIDPRAVEAVVEATAADAAPAAREAVGRQLAGGWACRNTRKEITMEQNRTRVCPRCGILYAAPPALSRRDNRTEICPACGLREALAAMPPALRKKCL